MVKVLVERESWSRRPVRRQSRPRWCSSSISLPFIHLIAHDGGSTQGQEPLLLPSLIQRHNLPMPDITTMSRGQGSSDAKGEATQGPSSTSAPEETAVALRRRAWSSKGLSSSEGVDARRRAW